MSFIHSFGRYPAFFIGIFMELVVGVSIMFSPNFITFTVLRFVLGTSNMGLFILGTVIGKKQSKFYVIEKFVNTKNIIHKCLCIREILKNTCRVHQNEWTCPQIFKHCSSTTLKKIIFCIYLKICATRLP